MMRECVATLVALGPIPSEDDDEAPIERWEAALRAIGKPLSSEEAESLLGFFPPDLAYGLGFTLLHLVESAPSWGRNLASSISQPEWRDRALKRLANVGS